QHPTTTATGQRVAALRFGDVRVQSLLGALCRFSHLPEGFRHRDLRPLVAGLLSRDLVAYSPGAMTYDLRRLRLHGLIARVDRTPPSTLTATGLRVAVFYPTLHRQLLQLGDCNMTNLPAPLRPAVRQLDAAIHQLWTRADVKLQAA